MTKTIDHLTFVRDLKEFVRMSDELYDDWKLQGDDGDEIYALKKSVTGEGLHTEHHITYSPSYKVPVIYFRCAQNFLICQFCMVNLEKILFMYLDKINILICILYLDRLQICTYFRLS